MTELQEVRDKVGRSFSFYFEAIFTFHQEAADFVRHSIQDPQMWTIKQPFPQVTMFRGEITSSFEYAQVTSHGAITRFAIHSCLTD
jgi:hypothetical protein